VPVASDDLFDVILIGPKDAVPVKRRKLTISRFFGAVDAHEPSQTPRELLSYAPDSSLKRIRSLETAVNLGLGLSLVLPGSP
jgi:hypothetical protein